MKLLFNYHRADFAFITLLLFGHTACSLSLSLTFCSRPWPYLSSVMVREKMGLKKGEKRISKKRKASKAEKSPRGIFYFVPQPDYSHCAPRTRDSTAFLI